MTSFPIQRILVPVDLSPCSGDALSFARSLAAALGASVDVLYVIEPSTRTLGSDAAQSPRDPAAAEESLQQFVESTAGAGSVRTTSRVESGDARDRIVSMAEREGFDMIVMGTHGRTGRPASLVGSVAESVVRTSPRPVLTVRETAR
jgi:nucleotide-binding universal stress UspA family protein